MVLRTSSLAPYGKSVFPITMGPSFRALGFCGASGDTAQWRRERRVLSETSRDRVHKPGAYIGEQASGGVRHIYRETALVEEVCDQPGQVCVIGRVQDQYSVPLVAYLSPRRTQTL